MTNTEFAFTRQPIDAAYVNSLVNLVNACREYNVKIDRVSFFQRGWHVTFEGYKHADAICHQHSYGSPCYGGLYDPTIEHNDWDNYGSWETIGFPWDDGDVSVHSADTLARMIHALDTGEDWSKIEGD